MANLATVSDLLSHVLFSAGELTDGSSDFHDQALILLNRVYRDIWMGGGALDPQINEDWWWLREAGAITLNPVIDSGTISVTNNDATAILSVSSSISLQGRFLKVDEHSDVFKISSHTAGTANMTLESVYTGDTDTTASYSIFQTDYTLANHLKLAGEMKQYRSWPFIISAISSRNFDLNFPLQKLKSGAPDKFTYLDSTTVRFNSIGDKDGGYIKIDYNYLRVPDDLEIGGTPLVPLQYRHVLSDFATALLMKDKDDTRASDALALGKAGMVAMRRENRQRWAAMGEPGHIYARGLDSARGRRFLKTQSGLILN